MFKICVLKTGRKPNLGSVFNTQNVMSVYLRRIDHPRVAQKETQVSLITNSMLHDYNFEIVVHNVILRIHQIIFRTPGPGFSLRDLVYKTWTPQSLIT